MREGKEKRRHWKGKGRTRAWLACLVESGGADGAVRVKAGPREALVALPGQQAQHAGQRAGQATGPLGGLESIRPERGPVDRGSLLDRLANRECPAHQGLHPGPADALGISPAQPPAEQRQGTRRVLPAAAAGAAAAAAMLRRLAVLLVQ